MRLVAVTVGAGGITGEAALLLPGERILGVEVPALSPNSVVWLEASEDGGTFRVVRNEAGNQACVWASGAGDFLSTSPAVWSCPIGVYVRPVLGTVQAAARTLTLIVGDAWRDW